MQVHGALAASWPQDAIARRSAERLVDHYNRYFEVVRANTPALRERVFRLRYEVYCLENPFENAAEFPDGMERDEFDSRSVHALLRHRSTGADVGTIRVILPGGERAPPLPVAAILQKHGIDPDRYFPRRWTAELSRFAVAKSFRRRRTDGRYPDEADAGMADGEIDRRIIPVMTLGLMMAALQIGIERGLSHACAVVEPTMFRLLARHGIELTPVGPAVDHHGLRQPCYLVAEELLADLAVRRPEIWEVITDRGRLAPVGASLGRRAPTGRVLLPSL